MRILWGRNAGKSKACRFVAQHTLLVKPSGRCLRFVHTGLQQDLFFVRVLLLPIYRRS